MTKIAEKMYFEDDKLIIKKTFDAQSMLDDAKYARDRNPDNILGSDYKHVGQVKMELVGVWLKEAGVAWTDTQAVKDVIGPQSAFSVDNTMNLASTSKCSLNAARLSLLP